MTDARGQSHETGRPDRRPRTTLVNVLIGVLVIGVGAFVVRDLRLANNEARQMYTDSVHGFDLIGELQYQTQEVRRIVLYALTTTDSNLQIGYADQSKAADARVAAMIREYIQLAGTPRESEVGRQLERDWATYLESRDEVMASILEGSITEAIDRHVKEGIPRFNRVRDDLEEIKQLYKKQAEQRLAEMESSFNSSLLKLSVILILTLLFAVVAVGTVQKTKMLHAVQQSEARLRETNQELNQTLQRLKETQDQLIIQEKLASLGALTAGIAHEIKNPLNFVNNFAALSADLTKELRGELAAQKDRIDAETLSYLGEILNDLTLNAEKINEHGQRADRIVRGMLMHSRGKSGERHPTDINQLLDEYVNLAYHGMRAQDSTFNVAIEKVYDDSIGLLQVVPQNLSRVFLNILNNACYATHEKKKAQGDGFSPVVSVRTKDLGGKVEVRIRDNGPGIPPHVRDRIFNPFFTTKPTGVGTGLGLSISFDIIVREHEGELRVETEEGQFAEFIITLPKNDTTDTGGPR